MNYFSLCMLVSLMIASVDVSAMKKDRQLTHSKPFGRGSHIPGPSSSSVQTLGGDHFETSSSLSKSVIKPRLVNRTHILSAMVSHTPGKSFSKEIVESAPKHIKMGKTSNDTSVVMTAFLLVEAQRKLGEKATKDKDEEARRLREKAEQGLVTKDEQDRERALYFYHDKDAIDEKDIDKDGQELCKARKAYLRAKAIKEALKNMGILHQSSKEKMQGLKDSLENEEKTIAGLEKMLEEKREQRLKLGKEHDQVQEQFLSTQLAMKLKLYDREKQIVFLEKEQKRLEKNIASLEQEINKVHIWNNDEDFETFKADLAQLKKDFDDEPDYNTDQKKQKEEAVKTKEKEKAGWMTQQEYDQKQKELAVLRSRLNKGISYYLKQLDDKRVLPVIKMFQ